MKQRRWTRVALIGVGAALVVAATGGQPIAAELGSAEVPEAPAGEQPASVITITQRTASPSSTRFRFGGSLGATYLRQGERATFDVEGGTYRIKQQQYSAWELHRAHCRAAGRDVPATIDLDRGLVLVDVQPAQAVECTFVNRRRAVINARVGDDANGNGAISGGEAWLSGAVVELYATDGKLIDTHVTDGNGRTHFFVSDGDYTVCYVVQVGRHATKPISDARGRSCRSATVVAGDKSWMRFASIIVGPAD